jgi:hypothetical protein
MKNKKAETLESDLIILIIMGIVLFLTMGFVMFSN